MRNYPSDISREQFEVVRADLENARKKTRPRKTDLYDIFCAVLYVVRGGIQWRTLPADFPKWQLVYYYFSAWKKPDESGVSLLNRVLKKLVKIIRENHLKKERPSLGVSQKRRTKNKA